VSRNHSLSYTFDKGLLQDKLHIGEEIVVKHKLASFSDDGSCCLPVFPTTDIVSVLRSAQRKPRKIMFAWTCGLGIEMGHYNCPVIAYKI